MKRLLILISIIACVSGCSTATGKGLNALNEHRTLDAIPHLEQGLVEGDKVAPMLLSLIYLSDLQVPADVEKAKHYYQQLTELEGSIYDQYVDFYLDYIQASILLKDEHLENDTQGMALLRQSKYLNYSPALMLLAKSYSAGKGVNKNYSLSHKLFKRSIEVSDNVQASLSYAWVLASHKDDAFSMGADPMDFVPNIEDVNETYQFIYYDTLAAIQARKGNFEDAIKLQNLAIELIKQEVSEHASYQAWLDGYKTQLDAFYNKEPTSVPTIY